MIDLILQPYFRLDSKNPYPTSYFTCRPFIAIEVQHTLTQNTSYFTSRSVHVKFSLPRLNFYYTGHDPHKLYPTLDNHTLISIPYPGEKLPENHTHQSGIYPYSLDDLR